MRALHGQIFTSALFACLVGIAFAGDAETRPLRRAEQVLRLSPAEATQQIPVDFTGVIVGKTAALVFHVSDGTHCVTVYVDPKSKLRQSLHPGRRVRITGVTDPGRFSPVVVKGTIAEDFGDSIVPPPQPVVINQLDLVSLDGQWIEVRGIVRATSTAFDQQAMIELSSGKEKLLVHLRDITPADAERLVDATLVVQGVCLHYFNAKGQFYETRLLAPAGGWRVEQQPASDPYTLPVQSTDSLLRYSFEGINTHRIHVQGNVTYVDNNHWFYLQDKYGSVRVRAAHDNIPRCGEFLDVAGFVAAEGFSPILEDAVFRPAKTGSVEMSIPTIKGTAAIEHEGQVVTMEGVLKGAIQTVNQCQLSVEIDGVTFDVFLAANIATAKIPETPLGSKLKVTGICRAILGPATLRNKPWAPVSVSLYARSPEDISVLATPPPTLSTIAILLAMATGAVTVAVLLWRLIRARGRINEQRMQRSHAETAFAAVLKERNRMAREIHDTLAQGLTSISVQVELARGALPSDAKSAPEVCKHLEMAKGFIRDGLDELRRTVRGLRPQIFEQCDLVIAIRKTSEQLVSGTEIVFEYVVEGAPKQLLAYIEDDLLHLAQEAVTNVVRHASATRLEVKLHFEHDGVKLAIKDNGTGFAQRPEANGGAIQNRKGFGLIGMEERLRPYNGKMEIQTSDQGTIISFFIPTP